MMRFKLLRSDVPSPCRASEHAAGIDFYSPEKVTVYPGGLPTIISTGVAVAIPEGFVGLVRERSSLAVDGLHVTAGIIDSDYRGEIKVVMNNTCEWPRVINAGTRFAQMLILPIVTAPMIEVEELPETERGEGGFGSTGKD